jgi:hypothetical protein
MKPIDIKPIEISNGYPREGVGLLLLYGIHCMVCRFPEVFHIVCSHP